MCAPGVFADGHITPASSECAQLWVPIPELLQRISLASVPMHPTLSKTMGDRAAPCPNPAKETAVAPFERVKS